MAHKKAGGFFQANSLAFAYSVLLTTTLENCVHGLLRISARPTAFNI